MKNEWLQIVNNLSFLRLGVGGECLEKVFNPLTLYTSVMLEFKMYILFVISGQKRRIWLDVKCCTKNQRNQFELSDF